MLSAHFLSFSFHTAPILLKLRPRPPRRQPREVVDESHQSRGPRGPQASSSLMSVLGLAAKRTSGEVQRWMPRPCRSCWVMGWGQNAGKRWQEPQRRVGPTAPMGRQKTRSRVQLEHLHIRLVDLRGARIWHHAVDPDTRKTTSKSILGTIQSQHL